MKNRHQPPKLKGTRSEPELPLATPSLFGESAPQAMRYICVEGPIGVGKTALAELLAKRLDAKLVKMRKNGARRLYSISEKGKLVLRDISRW